MQPDYNQLLRNIGKDTEAADAHFYSFFEDSLNQFISANSSNNQLYNNGSVALPAKDEQQDQ